MKVTNGLFWESKENQILIYDPKSQQKVHLTLHKPWFYFPFREVNSLTPIRIINPFQIDNGEYETTPDTLILLNPDILINSHLHEAGGMEEKIGKTKVINVSRKEKIFEV